MNAHASPLLPGSDSSLAAVLEALAPHDEKALVIAYGGRIVQPGYHVTEVKAGSFVTVDCGGNHDAWQETILQVKDLPGAEGQRHMKIGKFRGILAQVDKKVRLNADARLTLEVGPANTPMQIFDLAEVEVGGDSVLMRRQAAER